MRKVAAKAASLLCAAALGLSLAGCSVSVEQWSDYSGPAMPAPSFDYEPQLPAVPQQSATSDPYGSVKLLPFSTVLVSVYLDEEGGGRVWTDESIAQTQRNLGVAIEWMKAQCAHYNSACGIVYDDGEHDDLRQHMTYYGRFTGDDEAMESEEFMEQTDLLCEELYSQDLMERYGTASVGFLFFLPLEGCSFTLVHSAPDGEEWFYEYSCLYEYDLYSAPGTPESPAVYAHEILHLFGAADLYEGSGDWFVDEELSRYVKNRWPTSIMYNTYNAAGGISYAHIDRTIDPMTAYRLGLIDRFDGMERFPVFYDMMPGVFDAEKSGETWEMPIAARPPRRTQDEWSGK